MMNQAFIMDNNCSKIPMEASCDAPPPIQVPVIGSSLISFVYIYLSILPLRIVLFQGSYISASWQLEPLLDLFSSSNASSHCSICKI